MASTVIIKAGTNPSGPQLAATFMDVRLDKIKFNKACLSQRGHRASSFEIASEMTKTESREVILKNRGSLSVK